MFSTALKISDAKPKRTEPRSLPTGDLAGCPLFEALVCEIHWAALQIGGITCIMNACMERGMAIIPNSCRNQFPVEPPVVFAALSVWDDFGIAKTLGTRIELLYKQLAHARSSTEPFIGSQYAGALNLLPLQTVAQLTALWRGLAADANDVVNTLEPEVRWRIGGLYSENSIMLNRFLKDAVQGKNDCVDVQGEVILPVLPQRRKAQRFALQQPCKIAVRGKILAAFGNDVSMYGMGLACEFPFKLKEPIFIETKTGRRFKGVVAWSNGTRLGVQFDAALERTDPLISSQ